MSFPSPKSVGLNLPIPQQAQPINSDHPALTPSTTLNLENLPLEILNHIIRDLGRDRQSFEKVRLTSRTMRNAADSLLLKQKPTNAALIAAKRIRELDGVRKKARERGLKKFQEKNVMVLRSKNRYHCVPLNRIRFPKS